MMEGFGAYARKLQDALVELKEDWQEKVQESRRVNGGQEQAWGASLTRGIQDLVLLVEIAESQGDLYRSLNAYDMSMREPARDALVKLKEYVQSAVGDGAVPDISELQKQV